MDGDSRTDMREAVALAWRGKWTVLGLAVVAALIAAGILSQTPDRFDARAEILIDGRGQSLTPYEQVVENLTVDNAVVASEIAVLRSRRLLGQVVDRLGLAEDPGFGAAPPGRLARMEAAARAMLPALEAAPRLFPPAQIDPRARAVAALDRALTTAQKGRSYVMTVQVRAGAPEQAARIANTLADLYVADQLAAKTDATLRAADWLGARMSDLKGRAAASARAVEAYRAEQSVGDSQGAAVAGQQLAEINSQLVAARAARAEAEARQGQIQRLITEEGRAAAANVLSSPLILTLRQQSAEVRRREAELATRYGPKHPKMINVKAELADIRGAISVELDKRVSSLANDVAVAAAREASLMAALSDVEDRTTDLSRASVGLAELEREAEADRRIYEEALARFKETSEQKGVLQADARVISAAAPPLGPAAPKKGLITALAGAGGGLVALGFVFLAEMMANTFRTGAETQRILGAPVLAKIPRQRRLRRRGALTAEMAANPNSAFAEAVRSLRTALALSNIDSPPRVVMATSAAPGEGKSTTCLALAALSARMGRRAVVVECDMRRPSLARALDLKPRRGGDLLAALQGEIALEEALVPAPEGAMALPVAAPTPQAADILSSDRFKALVAELSRRFDLVLLDTPPALAVSDAAAVAGAADASIMLVRWDHTPRQAAAECLARLEEAGRRPVGVVLTLVDPRREAAYAYGGYGAGAPDYSSYYA